MKLSLIIIAILVIISMADRTFRRRTTINLNKEIKLDDKMIEDYNNIKMKKGKVLILSIDVEKNIFVNVFKGDNTFQYKDLAAQLPKDEPRFVAINFEYETAEKPPRTTSKLLFIFWNPITSLFSKKIAYMSSKSDLLMTFTGYQMQLVFSDYSQLDYQEIRKLLLKYR